MHWVGWDKVTRPVVEGGLGLQTAKGRNLAYLAKLNWRFYIEKDALRSKVMRNKNLSPRRAASNNEIALVFRKE